MSIPRTTSHGRETTLCNCLALGGPARRVSDPIYRAGMGRAPLWEHGAASPTCARRALAVAAAMFAWQMTAVGFEPTPLRTGA